MILILGLVIFVCIKAKAKKETAEFTLMSQEPLQAKLMSLSWSVPSLCFIIILNPLQLWTHHFTLVNTCNHRLSSELISICL